MIRNNDIYTYSDFVEAVLLEREFLATYKEELLNTVSTTESGVYYKNLIDILGMDRNSFPLMVNKKDILTKILNKE